MQLQDRPYSLDFAGNNPEWTIHTSPYVQKGQRRSVTYIVNSLPVGTVRFSSLYFGDIPDTSELQWNVIQDATDGFSDIQAVSALDAIKILNAIEPKIVYNPMLREHYDVDAWVSNGLCYIKFTTLEYQHDSMLLFHDDDDNAIVFDSSSANGNKRISKQNYRVCAFFKIEAGGKTYESQKMYMEDSDETVRIDCTLPAIYFQKPDIPERGLLFDAVKCQSATINVKLWFGEMYSDSADSAPMLHNLNCSPVVTLVNGTLQQYHADNNRPDWIDNISIPFHHRHGTGIFGQDDNDTVITPPDTDQFMYIYNYGAVGTTARVQAKARYYDTDADDNWRDVNVTLNPGVNRITVCIDDPYVVALRVEVSVNSVLIAVRNYIVKTFEHGYHTFLMLNALNLYETFVVETIAREEQTEGERRIIVRRDQYDTTDKQTVFTAKCHPRNANGLKIMRTAFAKQDNLLLDGKYAWYIDMVPGSLTVSDEGIDLTECEFKFRLREKINRYPQIIDISGEINTTEPIEAMDTVFK